MSFRNPFSFCKDVCYFVFQLLKSTTPCIPTLPYPRSCLDLIVLWPLQCYEAIAIIPVSFLRRRLPMVGGTLVILMALHGMVVRWMLDSLHEVIARIFRSKDPKLNFQYFWLNIQKRYAFFDHKNVNSEVVVPIFGDVLKHNTSEEDLWMNMTNIIGLLDDQNVAIDKGHESILDHSFKQRQMDYIHMMKEHYLADKGTTLANNFTFGMLNAQTSPGWNIGYLAITEMEGFVELLKLEALLKTTTQLEWFDRNVIKVPELFDLEAMRWALDVIFDSMDNLDGFVLDLRFNQGGGTLLSALTVASYFVDEKILAFSVHDKLTGISEFKNKDYYIAHPYHRQGFLGPLVILQSQTTSGTAELLSIALQQRPNTEYYGSPSSGNMSQRSTFQLPIGWNVIVPYQRCYNYKMDLYQYEGIPVKENVPFSIQQQDGDKGILKAVEYITHRQ